MTRRLLFLAALSLAALAGAACGGGDDANAGAADHNDADVEFAQLMIPHHEQAIEMAELALERAQGAEVKDLAQRIKDAQGPEIEEMKGWLESWGEAAEPGHGGGHGSGSGSGSGMMSDSDMRKLHAATGQAFDEMFLAGMIEHHEGAVAMAEAEVEKGKYPPAKALARKIIDAQKAEIEEMKKLQQAAG